MIPGVTPGKLEATAVIASSDANNANTYVSLSATLTTAIPESLEMLPDPTSITASSFFNDSYAPEFLFDADPTISDFENPDFDPLGQYAGSGEGPHVLVLDYEKSIDFDGFAFAQRLGSIIVADKVPSIEFWVSDTDPGAASTELPILSAPPEAMTDLVTTDTSALLRYYPLETILTGRYVVVRLAQGTFNPGGSELQLTLAGTPTPLQIQSMSYPGGTSASFTWNSKPQKIYQVERSTNMQDVWEVLDTNYSSDGTLTSFTDNNVPLDAPRMFYRVIEK